MLSKLNVSVVVFVSSLLAVAALPVFHAPASAAPAEDACALANEPAATPAHAAASRAGDAESVAASAQCNYLAKCCGGNTPNAAKCCEGYFKKCGRDGS